MRSEIHEMGGSSSGGSMFSRVLERLRSRGKKKDENKINPDMTIEDAMKESFTTMTATDKWTTFLALRHAPFRAVESRIIDKRFFAWRSSFVLFGLMIAIALLFNQIFDNFAPLKTLVDNGTTACPNESAFLDRYRQRFLQITNAKDASANATRAYKISKQLFTRAAVLHTVDNYTWPYPFAPSADDTAAIAERAKRTCVEEQCTNVPVVDPSSLGNGAIGTINAKGDCRKVEYACPDLEAVALLAKADVEQQQLELYRRIKSVSSESGSSNSSASGRGATVQQDMLNQLNTLIDRVSLASSLYVLYLGFSIFVGPPMEVAKPSFVTSLRSKLGGLSKYYWTLIIVVIWYTYEFFNILINIPDLQLIIMNIRVDPCWMEPNLVARFYNQTDQLCSELSFANNMMQSALRDYDYYSIIDKTYTRQPPQGPGHAPVYQDVSRSVIYAFNASLCSDLDVYRELMTVKENIGGLDWTFLLFQTSLLAQLLLQALIATLLFSLFQVFWPLSGYQGRVLLPLEFMAGLLERDEEKARERQRKAKKQNTMIGSFWSKLTPWRSTPPSYNAAMQLADVEHDAFDAEEQSKLSRPASVGLQSTLQTVPESANALSVSEVFTLAIVGFARRSHILPILFDGLIIVLVCYGFLAKSSPVAYATVVISIAALCAVAATRAFWTTPDDLEATRTGSIWKRSLARRYGTEGGGFEKAKQFGSSLRSKGEGLYNKWNSMSSWDSPDREMDDTGRRWGVMLEDEEAEKDLPAPPSSAKAKEREKLVGVKRL
ncbi:hypothetical protein BJ742DRAFT_807413 [Cladochytrium replicatum]|nr:hypothetical protein BJ742DRAFT_807413 [Cladochytrium replicatum]